MCSGFIWFNTTRDIFATEGAGGVREDPTRDTRVAKPVVAVEGAHIPSGLLHADGAFGSLTLVVEHGLVHEVDDDVIRFGFQRHLPEQLGRYGYARYLSKPVGVNAPLIEV